MDPKRKPGLKDLELLELTLTQDIELPFDDADDPSDADLDETQLHGDFEAP